MIDLDKELAKQAGLKTYQEQAPGLDGMVGSWEAIEAFADLIRADEREVWERRVARLQSLMDVRESQPNKPCCLAEREACAKVCDEHADDPVYCGAAIRARGNA